MNTEDNIIRASGLARNSNDIILPPGSLVAGDECVITKDNVISKRRGFELCNTGLPAAKPQQMFVSNGTLFVHINDKLYFKDSACNYAIINGPNPLLGEVLDIFYVNGVFYITGDENIKYYNVNSGYVGLFSGSYSAAGTADGPILSALYDEPQGIWGNNTDLFICDTNNFTIRQINFATATVSTLAGTAGVSAHVDGIGPAANFTGPRFIWGAGGFLYVTDSPTSSIRKIEISTATVTTLSMGFPAPLRGLWGDATHIYTSCYSDFVIYKVDITTGVKTVWAGTAGVPGSTDGVGLAAKFNYPRGVWCNSTDVYVADTENYTIRKINKASANVTTFAGTVGAPGHVDGIGTNAKFKFPYGIYGDADYLYVCDRDDYTIRRIKLNTAEVTTMLGVSGSFGNTDGYISANITGPT